ANRELIRPVQNQRGTQLRYHTARRHPPHQPHTLDVWIRPANIEKPRLKFCRKIGRFESAQSDSALERPPEGLRRRKSRLRFERRHSLRRQIPFVQFVLGSSECFRQVVFLVSEHVIQLAVCP